MWSNTWEFFMCVGRHAEVYLFIVVITKTVLLHLYYFQDRNSIFCFFLVFRIFFIYWCRQSFDCISFETTFELKILNQYEIVDINRYVSYKLINYYFFLEWWPISIFILPMCEGIVIFYICKGTFCDPVRLSLLNILRVLP